MDGSQSDVRSRISRVVQLVKGRLRRHDARKLTRVDDAGRAHGNPVGAEKVEMSVNLAILHRIDDTVDADFAAHKIGKGGRVFELQVRNLPLQQVKFLKAVVGKFVAYYLFRLNIIDIPLLLNCRPCYSVFPGNRRLAHVKGHGQDPCCHGQGCENSAHFQGFGFGLGLFAAAFSAVVSVCHRSYLLSVLFFSICSSFCLSKGISAVNGASAPAGNCSPVPQLISCLFKMLPTWRNPPWRCLLYHRRSPS